MTVGSEVAGGVDDVHISRCLFLGTDRGLRIKTRRGRGQKGVITDIFVENIQMKDVRMPITANMFYFCDPDGHTEYVQGQYFMPVDYRTPKVGNICVRDVTCEGVNASFLCAYGLPEAPIGKITLENIKVSYRPVEERTPERPIMMDNFDAMSGRSIFVKNGDEIICRNVEIVGSADGAPEIVNVQRQELEGLRYSE